MGATSVGQDVTRATMRFSLRRGRAYFDEWRLQEWLDS